MGGNKIRWYAVSGSWRESSPELVGDVRHDVEQVIQSGGGIVTGGALGVDFVATETALKNDISAERIKIILPTPLEIYSAHYRKRAGEGVITHEQAEALISLLGHVQAINSKALIEMEHTIVDQKSYFDRNTAVLDTSDELLAYQVNNSEGVQDTVDKAEARGMEVKLKKYEVNV